MDALISNSQVVITRSMQLSAQVLYNDPRGLCYYRTEIRNHNTRFELSQIKKTVGSTTIKLRSNSFESDLVIFPGSPNRTELYRDLFIVTEFRRNNVPMGFESQVNVISTCNGFHITLTLRSCRSLFPPAVLNVHIKCDYHD